MSTSKCLLFYRISFCTTCMGRLEHLKVTLPQNIMDNVDYPSLQFVVLDYNSRDGLEEWIKTEMAEHLYSGLIKYVKTTEPTHFHMARAKNMAHRAADGDILCNLDSDNYTGQGFAFFLNQIMNEDFHSVASATQNFRRGAGGRLVVNCLDYEELGGYNESYEAWGYDDKDFLSRALLLGLTHRHIPGEYLGIIPHSDAKREENTVLTKREGIEINREVYLQSVDRAFTALLCDGVCPADDFIRLSSRILKEASSQLCKANANASVVGGADL